MAELDLALQSMGMRALIATLEEIELSRFPLRPIVVLQCPNAQISSQYLCVMPRADSLHIVSIVSI